MLTSNKTIRLLLASTALSLGMYSGVSALGLGGGVSVGDIGIAAGIMPAATVAGAIVTAGGAFWLGLLPETALIPVGIVLALLVTDPATGATTTLGRLLSGALYAGLAALFATEWNGAEPVQYAVAAALLTSLASPLLDEFGLELWYARRRRRHGRT